jgi:hypothetical protein
MTEDQMNKLADIIVKKMLEKQAEYDAEFLTNLSNQNIDVEYVYTPKMYKEDLNLDEKDKLKKELSKYKVDLDKALAKEDYNKAAELSKKINDIEDKLK